MAKPVNDPPSDKGSSSVNATIVAAIITTIGTISVALINTRQKPAAVATPAPVTAQTVAAVAPGIPLRRVIPALPAASGSSGELQRLQFSGMYISKVKGSVADGRTCIRFYPDGVVVTASVSLPQLNNESVSSVLKWLNRDFQYHGRYQKNGSHLEFTISGGTNNTSYTGDIDELGGLRLKHSAANGNIYEQEFSFVQQQITIGV